MRQANGFLTDDGRFFERAEDADYYEARQELEGVLMLVIKPENVGKFITILERNADVIQRFYTAHNARQEDINELDASAESDPTEDAGDVTDSRDDGRGEEDAEAVQQQPVDGDRSVSHLGRSISAEEIQHRRAELSVGMREGDARRFRSGENMATGAQAEPAQTRSRRRRANNRQTSME